MIQLGVAQSSLWVKPAPNCPEQRNEQSKSHFWMDLYSGATNFPPQYYSLSSNKHRGVNTCWVAAQHFPLPRNTPFFCDAPFSITPSMALGVIHARTGWKAAQASPPLGPRSSPLLWCKAVVLQSRRDSTGAPRSHIPTMTHGPSHKARF